MEENQNNRYGEPRTYGEESERYERGQGNPYNQTASGQGNPYNQTASGQGNPYNQTANGQGNPYNQAANGQGGFGGGYQSGYTGNAYGQPPYSPYGGDYGMPQHGQVTDVFCNILLVVLVARMIMSMIVVVKMFSFDYMSIISGAYLQQMGGFTLISAFSSLLSLAYLVLIIIDIVKIHQAGYKITGLILFAIFLNQGYYIWRAHVLGRKKLIPIIYTVGYSLLSFIIFAYTFYMAFQWSFEMMRTMY